MRLIIDPPLSGPVNMARDEALLESVGTRAVAPTLRLYRWDPPTISLGYFQPYTDFEDLPSPAGELAVVRRTTGGGAILHDVEWTYSIVLPTDDPRCHPDPRQLYERMHEAIIQALALLGVHAARCGLTDDSNARHGPFFCFQRRHCLDVLLGADKIAGSAQRRTPHAILQHGSLMLDRRFVQQQSAALRDHIDISHQDLLEPLIESVGRELGAALDSGEWTSAELSTADALHDKYAGRDWTCKF